MRKGSLAARRAKLHRFEDHVIAVVLVSLAVLAVDFALRCWHSLSVILG